MLFSSGSFRLVSGVEVESIEFDIGEGYARSLKVPPLAVCYESKWHEYTQQLKTLKLPSVCLSKFLEKVCAPPCHPSIIPLAAWKIILPCLTRLEDWELPIVCWNEIEKALRSPKKHKTILIGLGWLQSQCSANFAGWLSLSPYNFCRCAQRLGSLAPKKAQLIIRQAQNHPLFQESLADKPLQCWLQRWNPLPVPAWFSDDIERGCGREEILKTWYKHQPVLQLNLLHRLLRFQY